MSEITYPELTQQVFTLYGAGEYAQALDLLEAEYSRFPEHAVTMDYNRIYLAALAAKHERVWQLFHEALDRGYWYSPEWMQNDESLISLRDQPELQEIVEICKRRLVEAQATSRPELLVFPTAPRAAAQPLLISMHGNTRNARNDSQPWAPITDHGWLLALPQSSQIVAYDAYVWNDREKSTSEICEHLANLTREYAIDPQRVVLGGFSMGGGQAVWMAAQQSIVTPGFVVLGPYLSKEEVAALPALLEEHIPANLRGYIIVGENDHECLAVARQIAAIMLEHGFVCELEVLPGLAHSYPADFSEHVARGVDFVTQQ